MLMVMVVVFFLNATSFATLYSTFTNNSADGGAIYNAFYPTYFAVLSCIGTYLSDFYNNTANTGGAVWHGLYGNDRRCLWSIMY